MVLAILLALGCGEDKSSVGGGDARDIEVGDQPNAASAGGDADGEDDEVNVREAECRRDAEQICNVFSKRNSPPFDSEQMSKCVERKTIKICEDKS
jgi:hypothetical protein